MRNRYSDCGWTSNSLGNGEKGYIACGKGEFCVIGTERAAARAREGRTAARRVVVSTICKGNEHVIDSVGTPSSAYKVSSASSPMFPPKVPSIVLMRIHD